VPDAKVGPQRVYIPAVGMKGIRANVEPIYLDNQELVDGNNMVFDDGALVTRPGFSASATPITGQIYGLGEFWDGTNWRHVNYAAAAAGMWTGYGAGAVTTYNYDTDTAAAIVSSSGMDTHLYAMAPTLGLQKLTRAGAAFAKIATVDNTLGVTVTGAKVLRTFRQHLVMFNTTESGTNRPQRMRWCSAGDPDTWDPAPAASSASWLDIVTDEFEIQNAMQFGQYMMVYKTGAIAAVSYIGGNSVYQVDTAVDGVGLWAPLSLISDGDSHLFIARDGIRKYSGGVQAPLMDEKVQPFLMANMSKAPSDVVKAFASFDRINRRAYFFAIDIDGSTWNAFVYDANYKSWFRYTLATTPVHAFYLRDGETTVAFSGSNQDALAVVFLLSGGATYGLTLQRDGYYKDYGTSYQPYFVTKDFTSGSMAMDLFIRVQRVRLELKGTSVDASYSVNGGTSWTAIATQALTSAWKVYDFFIDKSARMIRFKFAATGTDWFDARWMLLEYLEEGKY